MILKTNTKEYNIRDYGALGDGRTLDTKSIQKTIDMCDPNNGGVITFPAGTYICGTIVLKPNITLNLTSEAKLVYSSKKEDFNKTEDLPYKPYADVETSFFQFALLFGENLQNITIEGGGSIENSVHARPGPKPIALKRCNSIKIRDITVIGAPNYSISLLGCENVVIDNVKILGGKADGIDLDNCRSCSVSNCYVDAFDDAICLKTSLALGELSATTDISVRNCNLGSSCNCFKLGTESNGNFCAITVENCNFFPRKGNRKAIAGIAIESVDGGNIDGVRITNISANGVNCPIFLRLGFRGRGKTPDRPGGLKNIYISNVTAWDLTFPCVFAGIPEHAITQVRLENIDLRYADARDTPREPVPGEVYSKGAKSLQNDDLFNVPEAIKAYPEADMFGPLPCWGFYVRRVQNLVLNNISYLLDAKNSESNSKPCLILDDNSDLKINSLAIAAQNPIRSDKLQLNKQKKCALWLNQVSLAKISSLRFSPPSEIKISGRYTSAITFLSSDFEENAFLNLYPEVSSKEVEKK